jgi:signal transduction histidine kinase
VTLKALSRPEVHAPVPGGTGRRAASEPWNMTLEPADAPALLLELQQAAAGTAQELDVLLRLAHALRKADGLEAVRHALRAQRLARRLDDASSQVMAASIRSTCYMNLGDDRRACAVALGAVRRCSDAVHPATQVYAQVKLANSLATRGQLAESLNIFLKLLGRTYRAQFGALRVQILHNLGVLAHASGQGRQALRLFWLAQRFSAIAPSQAYGRVTLENSLAMCLVERSMEAKRDGQSEAARLLGEQAAGLARDAFDDACQNSAGQNARGRISVADTLAEAQCAAGRHDDALSTIDWMQQYMAGMPASRLSPIGGKRVQVQLLLDRGDAGAAVEAASAPFAQARDTGAADTAFGLATLLARAHEQLGQWQAACYYRRWLREARARQGRERVSSGVADLTERLDLGRSDLMPYLAHELRSPLASVLALLDDNRGGSPVTPAQREEVRVRVAQALDTAERVLEYARLQSLRQIQQDRVDLFALVDDACDEIAVRARARGVRIVLDPSRSLYTCGERTLLLRTVVGLIDNALRHSPARGTVRVQLEALPHCARLCIEDEGPGFDLDQVARLFEHETAAGRNRRVNLGLPLAARVIALHDGALLLDNRPQGGAKVLLALPLADTR